MHDADRGGSARTPLSTLQLRCYYLTYPKWAVRTKWGQNGCRLLYGVGQLISQWEGWVARDL